MPRRRNPKREIRQSEKLGDLSRNERQKAVLLCEVNRIRRDEVRAAVDDGKRIVEQSKKLCQQVEEGMKKRAS